MNHLRSIAAVSVLALATGVAPAALAAEGDDTLIEIGPARAAGEDSSVLVAPELKNQPTAEEIQAAVEDEAGGPSAARADVQPDARLVPPGFGDPALEGGAVPVARYWIGLAGGALPPEVRAQVDIEEGQGVLVGSVVSGSPAAEAGVRLFDVLVTAGGKPLSDMRQLADLVGELGEKGASIEVVLLRRGKAETVAITPVKRPIDLADDTNPWQPDPRVFGGQWPQAQPGGPIDGRAFVDDMLGQLQQRGLIPGEALRGAPPNGVSFSVQRQANGPAKVTVRRGEQVWEVAEGDAEALAAIPEDLRPTVERILQGQPALFANPPQPLLRGFGERGFRNRGNDAFQGQLEQMRQELDALRQQLNAPAPQTAPQQPAPSEVEIPAE
ncbi:MAG: PDZ domain-containing protein [Lacipirellulaceae bacterium]